MRVVTVVGARPQFIKAAPVSRALKAAGIEEILVHTGQHYDLTMDRVFFEELELPEPAQNLEVGSGTHAVQTGLMMMRLEALLLALRPSPDWVLVYGDTNSTLAGALVAAKLRLPLAHVEAGLRSYNPRMPEEVNRLVADRLADLLFCPSQQAVENLRTEGITRGVHWTGDVMLDALLFYRDRARERVRPEALVPFEPGSYYLLTVHRAENTDDPDRFRRLLALLGELDRPVVWPLHPRARKQLAAFGLSLPATVYAVEPVGYLAMIRLLEGCHRVLTDSGGLQKEAYWLGRPCLTLRAETEWGETVQEGWNHLVDLDPERLWAALRAPAPASPPRPHYGDGRAAERIAALLGAHSHLPR
ncbi:MAG: UDP-N-acetylglucosamine 2-epimerase (non-hydrolyzing) [Bacteroidetes bacterium]|nr:UDP-N-acetylglucosamine 2-epimerase (non-hydrolyzing) [Rhodothermia bacterium]MCS7155194.1 UDP-N-acetylglucosamine 2-epimerase (non-hydrolyzing) [Bacteroidota bacterium]MCX7906178.1 UDP-N-acetylglucosamine 2-epimerase (non-hydrolyzing) [Bacteroidota bacterium]MDW8138306.1 UDP-N-acetylglucosamine 2-epimerase (non-hydrolyzing) [Bacteroidota bacterium]MDW8285990.1 UDP-N-acetylglucosamine 2-epimerase (non-hydrolyzing) [Bacteroidota bacterium]